MKPFAEDNSGLSLIEVLVAMLILALVATPFLHAFVTTATANQKARRMQKATTLAQNVIEGLKVNGQDPAGYLVETFHATASDTDDSVFYMDDYEINASKFDVKVSVDQGQTDTAIQTINDEMRDLLPIMDKEQDAICMQLDQYTEDALIACDAKNELGQYDVTMLRREICLNVEVSALPSGGERMLVTATYHYQKIADPDKTAQTQVIAYDSAQTGKNLRSVYLFYTPLYPAVYAQYDTIRYVNDTDYPLSLYVYKQRVTADTLANDFLVNAGMTQTTVTQESEYKMQFLVECEAVSSFNDLHTMIYTNLYKNIADGSHTVTGTFYGMYFKSLFHSEPIDLKTHGVAGQKKAERMAAVSVSVYQPQASTAGYTDNLCIATLTGSFLE